MPLLIKNGFDWGQAVDFSRCSGIINWFVQTNSNMKEEHNMKKILSLLVALGMVCSLAACAGGNESQSQAGGSQSDTSQTGGTSQGDQSQEGNDQVQVMSYEEYMAAELDSKVVIEAYVQAKQTWADNQATVYAQDEDGAYFVYNMACTQEDYDRLTPGTCIRVTGYKAEWSGEIEIMDGTFEIVEGDTFLATPLDVTELLGTDELAGHQNQLVEFKGLTVEAAGQDDQGNDVAFLYNWDGSGSEGDDLYFNVSCNGQTYSFTVESRLCDSSTEVYSAVKNLEIGQTIDAQGFLYWYEGANPHITSVTVVE